MQKKYFELKSMINPRDIKDIITISKNIGAYQKSVQYSVYCYMSHLYKKNRKYENVYLVTSSVLLGCKISNFIPKMDILLENIFIHFKLNLEENEIEEFRDEVVKLELQMSVSLDFKFDIEDQYSRLKEFGEKYKLEKDCANNDGGSMNEETNIKIVQSTWIFLNDSLFYPFRLFFDLENILKACTYLSHIINNKAIEVDQFLSKKAGKEVLFIAGEILEGYEKRTKIRENTRII
ncbi:Apolipophorin [Nosema granulosis]|uniref:Apolipophorin n=1 Tax=Nosema granulosis TaxID=83296 RepID=A0A9P6KY17_9MICR|nr:Apolipophorin [Nosema granulosis]